jgi:3-phenylpropionate/trans-cinnamate dioxygenase ferredoxin reductase component
MTGKSCHYVIVGGGLTGASAVEGIREMDQGGSILLIGSEKHLPYDRPPLSKKLWFGKKTVQEIFLHDEAYYERHCVELKLGVRVMAIDPRQKKITDERGQTYGYEKLLLATGGSPRRLSIPGGDLEGIVYYRVLDDYLGMRHVVTEGKSAVIIGGGFIGSEIAAALNISKVEVTMVFPDPYPCARVFPDYLGLAIQERYRQRGIRVLTGVAPASFSRKGEHFVTQIKDGPSIESDVVIVGIGINPDVELARTAGLETGNGIAVNAYLQTSHPDIYAAGDNAWFPYEALGQNLRIEHWDNALNQGKWAGRNMAGARKRFDYMPYFFSDLFEFGYEAVGEVDSRLETIPCWQKENDTGVIYYLKNKIIRGVMMCNVWEKVDAGRALIRKASQASPEICDRIK